jgi:hypothetical protein
MVDLRLITKLDSLPKVFSYPPLTPVLSHKARGDNEEKTFGKRYTS